MSKNSKNPSRLSRVNAFIKHANLCEHPHRTMVNNGRKKWIQLSRTQEHANTITTIGSTSTKENERL